MTFDPEMGSTRLEQLLGRAGVEGGGSVLQRGTARLVERLGLTQAATGGGKGTISKILGVLSRGAIKHPVMSALDVVGMGIPLLEMGKEAINVASRGATGNPAFGGITTDEALQMEEEVRRERRRREVENQAKARRYAENTVSLIQNAPMVARQIMAGRRLPKGAVVIGGTPRVDLMQQMAGQMADGSFRKPDPLAELTGG